MFFTYFVLTVTTIVFKFCAIFARLSVGIAQNGLSLSLYTLMFAAKSRGAITGTGHAIFNSSSAFHILSLGRPDFFQFHFHGGFFRM